MRDKMLFRHKNRIFCGLKSILMFEPNRDSRRPENAYTKFVKYFSLAMSLLYPALGLFLIFSSPEQIRLDPKLKIGLGIVLLIYGVLRFVRTYQSHFKNRDRFRDEE
jgi:hypothetical protein